MTGTCTPGGDNDKPIADILDRVLPEGTPNPYSEDSHPALTAVEQALEAHKQSHVGCTLEIKHTPEQQQPRALGGWFGTPMNQPSHQQNRTTQPRYKNTRQRHPTNIIKDLDILRWQEDNPDEWPDGNPNEVPDPHGRQRNGADTNRTAAEGAPAPAERG